MDVAAEPKEVEEEEADRNRVEGLGAIRRESATSLLEEGRAVVENCGSSIPGRRRRRRCSSCSRCAMANRKIGSSTSTWSSWW